MAHPCFHEMLLCIAAFTFGSFLAIARLVFLGQLDETPFKEAVRYVASLWARCVTGVAEAIGKVGLSSRGALLSICIRAGKYVRRCRHLGLLYLLLTTCVSPPAHSRAGYGTGELTYCRFWRRGRRICTDETHTGDIWQFLRRTRLGRMLFTFSTSTSGLDRPLNESRMIGCSLSMFLLF